MHNGVKIMLRREKRLWEKLKQAQKPRRKKLRREIKGADNAIGENKTHEVETKM